MSDPYTPIINDLEQEIKAAIRHRAQCARAPLTVAQYNYIYDLEQEIRELMTARDNLITRKIRLTNPKG